jgi:predicted CopG family antitoxin
MKLELVTKLVEEKKKKQYALLHIAPTEKISNIIKISLKNMSFGIANQLLDKIKNSRQEVYKAKDKSKMSEKIQFHFRGKDCTGAISMSKIQKNYKKFLFPYIVLSTLNKQLC